MKIGVLKFAVSCFLLLGGCVTPAPKMAVPKITFDASSINLVPSKAVVKGQVFLTTKAGDVKLGAGKLVELIPSTAYTEERLSLMRQGLGLPPRAPELAKFVRKTVADAEGRFEFANVPSGKYHIASTLTWEYFDGRIRQVTGGNIVVPVTVLSDQSVTVMVTR